MNNLEKQLLDFPRTSAFALRAMADKSVRGYENAVARRENELFLQVVRVVFI